MPKRGLETYRAKRDPTQTPEPFGAAHSRLTSPIFVVQQHDARRMHWDLRLEIDGALVSWAVPRGPSNDPDEKRLAVQTEDHPLDYADFEGVIPADNYGAGPMIIWDRGNFSSFDGVPPADGLAEGKLDFELFGHKLMGRWALVRLKKSETGREWLLFKKPDAFADGCELPVEKPCSIVSGLDIAARADVTVTDANLRAIVEKAGGLAATLERESLKPMLASVRDEPFSDPDWIFELKYDGVRAILARTTDAKRHLLSRRGVDYRQVFPEIALVARYLPGVDFAIDGEIIAIEETGGGNFGLLQKRLAGQPGGPRVLMYAFDITHLAGHDLRSLPLSQRKELLRGLLPPQGPVRFADHIDSNGEALFDAARQRSIEGIIGKRADSVYRSGRRSDHWAKIKVPHFADMVVVGAIPGKGSRKLGSLMVAWLIDGTLTYAGNVGSGLSEKTTHLLETRMSRLGSERPEFDPAALTIPSNARLLRPEIVARLRFTDVTERGSLRHPVFIDLVEDVAWRECVAPESAQRNVQAADPVPSEAATLATSTPSPSQLRSNQDKVFWPEDGYTKGDLLDYYEEIWPAIAPYLADRPLVLTRYPDGIEGNSFFQKHAPEFTPEWTTTARLDDTEFFVCNTRESLLYIINLGCIPLHMWSAKYQSPDSADWSILDLDPKGAPFSAVVKIARLLHQLLGAHDVPHYVKTSGQAGLHILMPLAAGLTHEQAKMFAEVFARIAVRRLPEIATIARPLSERGDRVYVDFLQNGRGKTIAAPFCVRPIAGAQVSMPLQWSQVTSRLDPRRFTIKTAPRLTKRNGDPMHALFETQVDAAQMASVLTALQTEFS